MDAGVRTNEDMGRRGALQAACCETMEQFGRVAGQRKVTCTDSARELAEWGGMRKKWTDLQHAVRLGRTGDWWDLGVQYNQPH